MRRLPILLLAALVTSALPVCAAAAPYATEVQRGDPDARADVANGLVRLGWVDAKANGMADAADPDEGVYLDLDGTRTVTWGDLRLTGSLGYPAGTAVDYSNRDFGRHLEEPRGWLARDAAGHWLADLDGSGTASAGDVALTGPAAGSKLKPGDAGLGGALAAAQAEVTPAVRFGWSDANGNHQRDLAEPAYMDVNGDGEVSPGDLRFLATGVAVDDFVTGAELEAAMAGVEEGMAGLSAQDASLAAGQRNLASQLAALRDDLGALGSWMLVLGMFLLFGLAAVAWYARHLHRVHEPAGPPSRSALRDHGAKP